MTIIATMGRIRGGSKRTTKVGMLVERRMIVHVGATQPTRIAAHARGAIHLSELVAREIAAVRRTERGSHVRMVSRRRKHVQMTGGKAGVLLQLQRMQRRLLVRQKSKRC